MIANLLWLWAQAWIASQVPLEQVAILFHQKDGLGAQSQESFKIMENSEIRFELSVDHHSHSSVRSSGVCTKKMVHRCTTNFVLSRDGVVSQAGLFLPLGNCGSEWMGLPPLVDGKTRTRSDDLLGNEGLVPSFTPLVWQYLCLHQKTWAALWSKRHPDAKLPPLAQPGNLSRLGVQIPSKTSKNFCNDPFQNASSGNVEKSLATFAVICSFRWVERRSSKSLRWGRSSAPFRPWRVGSWVSLQVSAGHLAVLEPKMGTPKWIVNDLNEVS